MTEQIPTGWRSRRVVFVQEDELAYDALLRDAFPHCGYREWWQSAVPMRPAKIIVHDSIAKCRDRNVWVTLDTRSWQYQVAETDDGLWYINTKSFPAGRWERHTDPQNYYSGRPSPPQLRCSEISFLVRTDDTVGIAQADKALRLLEKVASRKAVQYQKYPSREPRESKMANPLVGHHALEWAKSSPDYWIELSIPATRPDDDRLGSGYRPIQNDEKR